MQDDVTRELAAATGGPHSFRTTHWSIVALAGDPASPETPRALEKVCRTYWLPLYSFIRRKGYGPHDAEDLTQGSFARLLRMNSLSGVGRQKEGSGPSCCAPSITTCRMNGTPRGPPSAGAAKATFR
jgi:hypothetical protein